MGFIASEINKEHDKYILLEDIVLLVQELDGDNPSLSDTAKFLLQKYEEHYIDDIPFGYVDDSCFTKTLSGRYEKANHKRPLFYFLEFVAFYNSFDDGWSEDNPNWTSPNEYLNIYLTKRAVAFFLKNECGLKDFHGWQEFEQESQAKGAATEKSRKHASPHHSRPCLHVHKNRLQQAIRGRRNHTPRMAKAV